MPKEYSRSDRVADAIQRELAQLVRDEMRDPRVTMLNITAVDVSRDMSAAKVYVNFVAPKSDEESAEAVAALNHAAGFLRTHLSKILSLRMVPTLRFFYDGSGERGQALSALIDFALSQDKVKHVHDDSDGEQ
ncbi:MAG: 30S ribosome-binding factor RbfA [Porticoccaceae bacterium]|jgi:ribosome-binding factor A